MRPSSAAAQMNAAAGMANQLLVFKIAEIKPSANENQKRPIDIATRMAPGW